MSVTINGEVTTYGAELKKLKNNKVGYAEYSGNYLYLYTDSTKTTLIAKLLIEGGSTTGGISEAKCKEIIESYGYAVADDFYSKDYIDGLESRIADIESKEATWNAKATSASVTAEKTRAEAAEEALAENLNQTKEDLLEEESARKDADIALDTRVKKLEDSTEEDPTVPDCVKAITQYDINKWDNNIEPTFSFEVGLINASTGVNGSFSKRMRTVSYIDDRITSILVATGYRIYIYGYSSDGTYLGTWDGSSDFIITDSPYGYGEGPINISGIVGNTSNRLRIMIARNDAAVMTVDADSGCISVSGYKLYETFPNCLKNVTQSDVDKWNGDYVPEITFHQGLINFSTGETGDFAKRIYSDFLDSSIEHICIADDYKIWLYIYDSNETYIGALLSDYSLSTSNANSFKGYFNFAKLGKHNGYKIKIMVAKADTTIDINPDDDSECVSIIGLYDKNKSACYATIGVYNKVGCIGDSYSSGGVENLTDSTNMYRNSWGQILARRNGNTCINFSYGGCNTRRWLDDTFDSKGIAKLNSEDPCDIYFICLGINDSDTNEILHVDVGTADDYDTDNDTYYANMYKIINAVKLKAPDAMIVIMDTPKLGSRYKPYDVAAEAIADYFGLPFIDLKSDDFFTSAQFCLYGEHPTTNGYGGMALAIERLYSKCVADYMDYFSTYLTYTS